MPISASFQLEPTIVNKPPHASARGILGNTLDGFFSWASSSFTEVTRQNGLSGWRKDRSPGFQAWDFRRRENKSFPLHPKWPQ